MAVHRLVLILAALLLVAAQPAAASLPPSGAQPVRQAVAIGCTEAELSTALAAGGPITFSCGAGSHSILFNTPLAVSTTASLDGANQITLSGQNMTDLFEVQPGAALTLARLTVSKGFANADGGAIRVSSGGSLTIQNCTFTDNHTSDAWSGGAILSRGALRISNSTFDHNTAGNGGALDPRDGSSSTVISNTLFLLNTTTSTINGWGGAVLLWVGAGATIRDSKFISNTSNALDFNNISLTAGNGGAVYITNFSSLTLERSELAGNAAFHGGALYVESGGSLTVTGSNLHDNSIGIFDGTQGGAAIYNLGNLLVDHDLLHDNHADGAGGGLDNVGPGTMLVRNSVIRHNFAGGGGAIDASGNTTVLTSTLEENIVSLYGGAIDAANEGDPTKALTVTASTLSGNFAGSEGGAIEGQMRMALTNVTISGNSGPQILEEYIEPLTLSNVTLAQNTGVGLGLHNKAPLQLRNTLLAHNSGGNCAAFLTGTLQTSLSDDGTCGLMGGRDGVSLPVSGLHAFGGPTLTQMIPPGSPAQDHGGFCPPYDQRGQPRTGPAAGLACDIGAVERQGGEPFGFLFLPILKK